MLVVKNDYNKHKIEKVFKFSMSSIISFIVDYSLFTILSLFSLNLILCNILARMVSVTFNYTINRKYVFKSNNNIYKSVLSYLCLAIVILFLNTLFLHILVGKILISRYVAKILVEIILLVFNYFIQKKWIF